MESFEHIPKYPVQTLAKALDILRYLKDNSSTEGVSISEISRALTIGKSGVHRTLDTLMAYGFVEKAGANSTNYLLGWGLFDAGNAVPKQHTLNGANYIPQLEKLCNRFSETVNMGVFNQYETVIICKIEPNIKLRTNTQVGEREPLYATALGKLFLSDFSPEELAEYFANIDASPLAANTITTLAFMQREVAQIRRQGYALDNEEYVDGMICFAMPIRDFTGKTISGISVSGPARRMTPEKLENIKESLAPVCQKLSAFLGYN
ncbi:MAG TPA: IclR family transcriptional regulator [Firmicutes bacterium]|nr:IclR family transcriptional regulator [Bacillota bacterium]